MIVVNKTAAVIVVCVISSVMLTFVQTITGVRVEGDAWATVLFRVLLIGQGILLWNIILSKRGH